MEAREIKAWEMTGDPQIAFKNGAWRVRSQTGHGFYHVNPSPSAPACECDDFGLRGEPCKHILAVRLLLDRQLKGEPNPAPEAIPPRKPSKTYPQDWPAYNAAQTHEKDHLQELLADLCRGVPQPPDNPKGGHAAAKLADAIFGVVFKVYSMVSSRRFMCDLREAQRRGHVESVLSYNCIMDYMGYDALTPILVNLIGQAALPLRAVERTFAIDSSGFSTCRYSRWFDEKYGANRAKADWVKCHLCVGTKTQVVTAVVIGDKHSGDSPQFDPLARETARNFTVEEMSADKAYLSGDNLELIAQLGGTPFIPFKTNSLPGGAEVWRRMFHYFAMNREDFLQHYHRRSLVESAFSMIKRKFGDSVRAKTDVAMRNEVLAKVLCHNICCCISAWYELGIEPGDWMPERPEIPAPADAGPRLLRFPAG